LWCRLEIGLGTFKLNSFRWGDGVEALYTPLTIFVSIAVKNIELLDYLRHEKFGVHF